MADLPPVDEKLAAVGKPNVAQISSGPSKGPSVFVGTRNQRLVLKLRLLSAESAMNELETKTCAEMMLRQKPIITIYY